MEPRERERERRSGGADKIKSLLDEMESLLRNSKKSLVPGGGFVVDRDRLGNILDSLRRDMPAELEQARMIVREQKAIMLNAEREYNEKLQQAQDEAGRLKAEADEYALRTREDARNSAQIYYDQKIDEGNKMLIAYQNQATRVLAEANEHAEQLVDESEIMIRANVEADELRARAYDEMDRLRRDTFQYLDDALMDVDEAISKQQMDLRRLRQTLALRGHQEMEGY